MKHSDEAATDRIVSEDRTTSVLIVTHQSDGDIGRCLEALKRAAPRSRLEILVLDNASSDQTVAKLQAAGISVICSNENTGFGAAVNQLAAMADTPFIFLLNPDSAPMPGAIDTLIDAAMALPERKMFCGRTVFENGRENRTSAWGAITPRSALLHACGLSMLWPNSPLLAPESLPDWDRLSDREVDVATGCALLIRTETWRALNGFDARYWLYGEEAEMQLRMVRAGGKRAWFVAAAKFIHDNSDRLSDKFSLEERIFRSTAILRGRSTIMRHAWTGRVRWVAAPILALTALRHGLQGLLAGAEKDRHKTLWRTRADWMAGYPAPDSASGSVSRIRRLMRLVGGVLDPRAYLHALRIVNFYNYTHVKPRRQISLGTQVEISPNATFSNGARIRIGNRTLIAAHVSLMAGGVHGRITIGDDCMIGPGAFVTAANYKGNSEGRHRSSGMSEADVIIEDNVWIGAGVVILPGVRVGRGAIIGASTVISKNVPPKAVYVGAPVRALQPGSLPWIGQEGSRCDDQRRDGAPQSEPVIGHGQPN